MPGDVGRVLVESGILTAEEVSRIVAHANEHALTFGESAKVLGLLSDKDLVPGIHRKLPLEYFHLQPKFFPVATIATIPLASILKWGVLPLGRKHSYSFFKKKETLNVGCLNPTDKNLKESMVSVLPQPTGIHLYFILVDEFFLILEQYYGVGTSELEKMDESDLHPMIVQFLEDSQSTIA